jgi:DNA-binding beta-propeller fold protein YncE
VSGVFISYRRGNTNAHAGRLYDRLKSRFGSERVFMDVDTIPPGIDFIDHLQAAVASCDAMLVLIGNDWLYSRGDDGERRLETSGDLVRLEVATALDRDVRVVPVLLQGVAMPKEHELPGDLARLARRNALTLSDTGWSDDVERLVDSLDPVLDRRTPRRFPRIRPRWAATAGVVAGAAILVAILASGRDGGGGAARTVSGTVRQTLPVGRGPTAVAVGHGAGWVVNWKDGTLQRFSLSTGEVAFGTPVGEGASYLAVDGRWVWVTVPDGSDPGRLLRIDPTTGEIDSRIRVKPYPAQVAVGDGAVWVLHAADQVVMKFDAQSGAQLAAVRVGGAGQSLAVSPTTVWVPDSGTSAVIRIDPDTARIIEPSIAVESEPTGIAVGAGTVWVANSARDSVTPVDIESGQAGAPIRVGRDPGEIAVSEGAVWVSNEADGTVSRIDPHTLRVVGRPIDVGRSPAGLAVGAGSVWVPNVDDDTVSRIEPG